MTLFENPQGRLKLLIAITVIGTSLLVAVEASNLGMGKKLGSDGKKEEGPITWLIACLVLWVVGFPWYMSRRKHYGRKGLALPALGGALLFIGCTLIMADAIDSKVNEVRQRLNAIPGAFP